MLATLLAPSAFVLQSAVVLKTRTSTCVKGASPKYLVLHARRRHKEDKSRRVAFRHYPRRLPAIRAPQDDGLVPSPEPLALRLGRSGSSYAHGQGPSTGRLRDPHQPHHEEDGGRSHVVALLQRSASAAVGAQGPGAGAGQLPAGQQQQQAEGVGAAAAAGGGAPPRAPGGHRFTLFGSDITNRGGGGGAEHLQVRCTTRS